MHIKAIPDIYVWKSRKALLHLTCLSFIIGNYTNTFTHRLIKESSNMDQICIVLHSDPAPNINVWSSPKPKIDFIPATVESAHIECQFQGL